MNTKDAAPEFNGTVVLPSGEKLRMIKVEAGSFIMSADDGENEKNETPHPVTLKYDFYLGETMVTQAQWKAVMGFVPEVKTIGSRVMRLPEKESRDRPVTVSWYEAMDFCARLNELNLAPAGYRFTLPTETQWEYAARGGSMSRGYRYSGSDDLNEVAWTGDAESTIYPVAKKKPNELGLYDMSGNEREWSLDDYDSHEDSSKVIPEFSRGSEFSYADRACRGGNSMGDGSKTCRPGRRDGYTSYKRRIFGIAFRVALASTALPEHPQYAEERRRAEEYRRNCVSGDFVVELPGNVKLGMVKVEPGTFEMGAGAEGLKSSGSSSALRFFYFDKDVKPHPVTLTHDYYIGKTVVTQEQWKAVMKKEPHGDRKSPDMPMHEVSWYMAMDFCARLNELNLAPAGYRFTLPTEAQWEYAARGGCHSRHYQYSGSDDLKEVAWAASYNFSDFYQVARKKANELGLYDMSGNTFEWCLDDYKKGDRTTVPEFSRNGEKSFPPRVCRGGCHSSIPAECANGARSGHAPSPLDSDDGFAHNGFRIVLSALFDPKPSDNIIVKLPAGENLEMVKVAAGSFTMGAQRRGGERFQGTDETPHQVTLTKDFYIARTPVTQAQWKAILGKNCSTYHCAKNSGEHPVGVSWKEAMAICKKLNERGKAPAGYKFTLPTEAQWEYAARGGSRSRGYRYSGSNDIKEVAWYYNMFNGDAEPQPVGVWHPNELDLYDMSGNVDEWCLDWYADDYGCGNADATDPAGPSRGSCRVCRGGSCRSRAEYCRSISRDQGDPNESSRFTGFRLALIGDPGKNEKPEKKRKADAAENAKLAADRAKGIVFSEDGTTLIRYPAEFKDKSYTVPEGVTEIANNAFGLCKNLVRVTLPEGVMSIGLGAFESCIKLTAVDIPGSVRKIGSCAFIECSSLAHVKIPDGVKRIEDSVFWRCSSLAEANIPAGVTRIGASAFQGCTSLARVEIPEGVTRIGASAFKECAGLTEVSIPAGVTRIEDSLFQSCSSLVRARIPDGVTYVGGYAFDSCEKLSEVNIPDGVTSIGEDAFRECKSITELHLPDSVTQIGAWAFEWCEKLVRVNIPDSVTSIDSYAFSKCRSLTDVHIPDGVTCIESGSFEECRSLVHVYIPESVTSISLGAFRNCSSLTAIRIPDSVTYISDDAFKGCRSLAHIRIPDGVHIGTDAFEGCKKKP